MGKSVFCRGNSMLGGLEGSTGVGGIRLLMILVQSVGGQVGELVFYFKEGQGLGGKRGVIVLGGEIVCFEIWEVVWRFRRFLWLQWEGGRQRLDDVRVGQRVQMWGFLVDIQQYLKFFEWLDLFQRENEEKIWVLFLGILVFGGGERRWGN